MVPTGAAPACSGARPIVLYAHGTNTDKNLNIADITDPTNTEGVLIAAMFAAQGYIVVAPNYAGYDISTLATAVSCSSPAIPKEGMWPWPPSGRCRPRARP
jgi:predicted dienelactone hydrolase